MKRAQKNQTDIFIQSESDAWYLRNKAALGAASQADSVLGLFELYHLRPKTALEIGAADGYRLDRMRRLWGTRGTAVEPSSEAIRAGRKKYPAVRFVQAPAHAVPVRRSFDAVIVNFVLHWVARPLLARSLGEIDRLVKPGGYLAVGDFYPRRPVNVRYHHLADQAVYTYKRDYPRHFLSTGRYEMIALLTRHHASHGLSADYQDRDRAAVALLRKLPPRRP
jgi:SAM-dependent methyltransferase